MARGRVTESSGFSPREPRLIAQGAPTGEVLTRLGESEFEQSPVGMWLSSHRKAISFQVPSAAGAAGQGGKAWGGEGWGRGGGQNVTALACPRLPLCSRPVHTDACA